MDRKNLKFALAVAILAVGLTAFWFWYMAPFRACVHERTALTGDEQAATAECLKEATSQ